jgi:undecaprenyl-diphosphatase
MGLLIVVGFVVAFVSDLLVVRSLLNFVSTRGFAPFAWLRIIVGVIGMIGQLTVG